MNALALTLTAAGNAELVNAQNGGTNAVVISQVGLTSTAFVPTAALTQLPGEFKRVGDVAGEAASPDIIHLVMTDSSADAYSLLGFGLYLADGTLFATYGQATELVGKAAVSLLLLALDVELTPGAAAAVQFGNANFLNPPSTEETVGVVRLATAAEATALTSLTLAVSPGRLAAVLAGYASLAGATFAGYSGVRFNAAQGANGSNDYDSGALFGLTNLSLAGEQRAVTFGTAPGGDGFARAPHQALQLIAGNTMVGRFAPDGVQLAFRPTWAGGAVPWDSANFTPANYQPVLGYTPVKSVAGRNGDVVLGVADVAGAAPAISPAFGGTPQGPTPADGDNSQNLATTAFVARAIADLINGAPGALDTLKQLADAIGDDASFHTSIMLALAAKAALESPVFTGSPSGPTRGVGDNSGNLATTAFVYQNAPGLAPVQSVAGRTGAILLGVADVAGLGSAAQRNVGDFQAAGAAAGGDLQGNFPNPSLKPTGVVAGTYASPNITVDANGRVTAISSPTGGLYFQIVTGTAPAGTTRFACPDAYPNLLVGAIAEASDVSSSPDPLRGSVIAGDNQGFNVTNNSGGPVAFIAYAIGK